MFRSVRDFQFRSYLSAHLCMSRSRKCRVLINTESRKPLKYDPMYLMDYFRICLLLDDNRLYSDCLGASITCLCVALSLSNSAVAVQHVWSFGWIGCLVACIIFRCSPDSRSRADSAKLPGTARDRANFGGLAEVLPKICPKLATTLRLHYPPRGSGPRADAAKLLGTEICVSVVLLSFLSKYVHILSFSKLKMIPSLEAWKIGGCPTSLTGAFSSSTALAAWFRPSCFSLTAG